MNTLTPTHFFAETDLVVVGHDGEYADITNPRGAIYGYAAYVVAEAATGARVRRYIGAARFEAAVLPKAEAEAAALNMRLNKLGKLPVAFSRWEETYACYGSEAHSNLEMVEWEHSLEMQAC